MKHIDYNPHESLLTAVVLDGLNGAIKEFYKYEIYLLTLEKAKRNHKARPKLPKFEYDYFWVKSKSSEKKSFEWYCNLLHLNAEYFRNLVLDTAKKAIKSGKPPVKFRELS